MAVYRPLISDGNTKVREATNSEYQKILRQIGYLYYSNPTVSLVVVSSGGSISPQMRDRRYFTGASVDTGDTQYNEFNVTVPPVVEDDVFYDKIQQSFDTTETKPAYALKPVRPDGNNGVIEISEQDVIDTYIDPVVSGMVTGSSFTNLAAGSYRISTTNIESNQDNLGIVYTDTRSVGFGAYPQLTGTGGQQFTNTNTVNTYYLKRVMGFAQTYRTPLIIDGTTGLRHMTTTEFDTYFQRLIRHYIYAEPGYMLRFNINGSGTTRGSVMIDTFFESSTEAQRVTDGSDTDPNDYISQMQPSGTFNTDTTYSLKVERT
tara:strand:- start:3152 stop:4105 length:954 start_codon:yes stop_codon:yes gene_type:complete